VAFALWFVLSAVHWATPAGADQDLGWINGTRSSNGLSALAQDSPLDSVARSHTEEMMSRGSLYHSSNLAGTIGNIHPDWETIGENVGVGPSAGSIEAAFMRSADHRVNVLGTFNLAGTATMVGPDGRVWITEEFVQVPAGRAAAPTRQQRGPAPAPHAAETSTPSGPSAPPTAERPRQREPAPSPRPAAAAAAPSPDGGGYWLVGEDGGVFSFGDAPFMGSLGGKQLNAPVAAVAATPAQRVVHVDRHGERERLEVTRRGYWLVGADGGVFSFGDAPFLGSLAGMPLSAPMVAAAPSRDGHGYWLVDSRGGVFSLGNAAFMGSVGGVVLNAPVAAVAPTPDGGGYWLVGADGGVFAFGDAPFMGSLVGVPLNAPIASVVSTPDGGGYWLVGADGGVFAFGDAPFMGSLAGKRLNAPVAAATSAPEGSGYSLVGADGGVFSFGSTPFATSAAGPGSPPA
jgi:hypothetical protein